MAAEKSENSDIGTCCVLSLSGLVLPTCPVFCLRRGKRADWARHENRQSTHLFYGGRPGEQGQVQGLLYESVGQNKDLERFRISNTEVQTACGLEFPPLPNPLPPGERGSKVQTGNILYILNRLHWLNRAHGLHLAKVFGEGGLAEALQRDVHHGPAR